MKNVIANITTNLNTFSGVELAAKFNELAVYVGEKTIKKFASKSKGVERVTQMLELANAKLEIEAIVGAEAAAEITNTEEPVEVETTVTEAIESETEETKPVMFGSHYSAVIPLPKEKAKRGKATPKKPEPKRSDKATWITIVTADENGVETEDGPKSMTEVGNAKCLKVASKIKVYAWNKTPSDAQKRTLDRYKDIVEYFDKTEILDKELVASWGL